MALLTLVSTNDFNSHDLDYLKGCTTEDDHVIYYTPSIPRWTTMDPLPGFVKVVHTNMLRNEAQRGTCL